MKDPYIIANSIFTVLMTFFIASSTYWKTNLVGSIVGTVIVTCGISLLWWIVLSNSSYCSKNIPKKVTEEPKFVKLYKDEFPLTGSINFRVSGSWDHFTLIFRDSSKPCKAEKNWDWMFIQSFSALEIGYVDIKELAMKTYKAHLSELQTRTEGQIWLESEISKLKKGNGKLIKTLKNESE